jgi:hypothetical protein
MKKREEDSNQRESNFFLTSLARSECSGRCMYVCMYVCNEIIVYDDATTPGLFA